MILKMLSIIAVKKTIFKIVVVTILLIIVQILGVNPGVTLLITLHLKIVVEEIIIEMNVVNNGTTKSAEFILISALLFRRVKIKI